MVTLEINLNSADALRANWEIIKSTPGKLQELIDAGIVSVAAKAANNSDVEWRVYTGKVDVSLFYRAYGEKIADKLIDEETFTQLQTQFGGMISLAQPYIRVTLDQVATQAIALYVLAQNPAVQAVYLALNNGVPLEILPPYEPEPVVETLESDNETAN